MTQAALARAIGAEQSTVSGWESEDDRQPSRGMIPRIAKALGLTPEYLEFGKSGAPTPDRPRTNGTLPTGHVGEEIDPELMSQCIKMAMQSLVGKYGLDIPQRRYNEAADAALSSYLAYFRLRDAEEERGAA